MQDQVGGRPLLTGHVLFLRLVPCSLLLEQQEQQQGTLFRFRIRRSGTMMGRTFKWSNKVTLCVN